MKMKSKAEIIREHLANRTVLNIGGADYKEALLTKESLLTHG